MRTLVAGVGNIFLGDDGFGVEVVRQLGRRPLPAGVEVADIGIRGVHLAYELLDGCDLLVLVDASARGQRPGTVSVIEVDLDAVAPGAPLIDPHSLTPDDVFGMLRRLGGRPGRTLVVACEPVDLGAGMALSAPVEAAVAEALRLIETILEGSYDAVQTGQDRATGAGGGGDRTGAPGRQAVREDEADVVHEFGLAEGVLDAVRRRAGGRPVSVVRVRAGVRHAIDADSMGQAFQIVAQGTEAADARLDLAVVPARITCRACGASADTHDLLAVCPGCGADAVDLTGGDELVLESLEYLALTPSVGSQPAD